jgi:hypothetical protein
MSKKVKEEEINVKSSDDGSNRGTDSTSTGSEQGNGDSSGGGGNVEVPSGSEQGGIEGSGRGSEGSSEGRQGGEREGEKVDLLQRIRSKRSNGQRAASSNPDGASNGNREGNATNLPGSKRGASDDDGASPGPNRTSGRGGKQDRDSDGGTGEITQGNESSGLKKEKAAGVNIKGVDKIKALAQKAAQAEPPKLRFAWDEKPLSNKEGDEMLPKVRALLEFVFRHMDKGISISNRQRIEAHIWSTIDGEDLDIIATHLVEMGKASKIVATAVRRMTNSYRLLQIGLITLPKFVQTYQFYASHGGFTLGGVK